MAWTSIPNFGDEHAKINERLHNASGANIVEVLYGARDAAGNPTDPKDAADGHGHWIALEIDGVYQMLSWRHPQHEGGAQEYGKNRSDNPLSDLEADITAKTNICTRAESLAETSDFRSGAKEMKSLFEKWKKIYNWHTPKENELWKRFSDARARFYDRRNQTWSTAKTAKQNLISQAAAISSSEDWKATGERMKELMDEWKKAGYAGPDDDEGLWQQFSTERQVFYDRRSKFFENLESQHSVAKNKKQSLIAEARSLSNSEDWKATGEKMKQLMEEWKAAGSAGHRDDELLWDEFCTSRQTFFDRRKAFFDERDRQFANKAAEKSSLIQVASAIASACDYSNENADKMKDLDRRWKEIGFCGKDEEQRLWNLFSEAKETFWEGRRRFFEERRANQKIHLQEVITRKQNQIADLYGQIDHLQGKMEYVTNQEYIDNMCRWIDEKRDKIRKLETDISDIERKL